MKSLFFLFCLLPLVTLQANAADLLVEQFAPAPSYNSIAAAVAAASNGDRIIIKAKSANAPWAESITVNKSLTFLPYSNDTFFVVQGTYTIIPADGREVNIIGMRNTLGNITATTAGNTSNRTVVNIFGSTLTSGSILFDVNGYNVTLAHTKLDNGQIKMRSGGIFGCEARASVPNTNNEAVVNIISESIATTETIKIFGNRFFNTSTQVITTAFQWNSNTHFFDIRNNFCTAYYGGILVINARQSTTVVQYVNNNTLQVTNGSGIALGSNVTDFNNVVEITNNLFESSSSVRGVSLGNTLVANISVTFNMMDNNISSANRVTGLATINLNNNGGNVILNSEYNNTSSSAGVDAGDPSNIYADLDLSVNDCGAYGGSYSMANFFPIHFGSARVYNVIFPFYLRQGSTLNVKGQSYDR